MKNLCSRLPASLKMVGTAFFFFSLVLLSVERGAAQPGDRRSPEERRKDLQRRLDKIDKQINENDGVPYRYEERGQLYTQLYGMTQDREEQELYIEKAFADFALAEEMGWQVFQPRAELHSAIWRNQISLAPISGASAADILDVYYRNSHFDDAVADYLEAARIILGTSPDYYRQERAREYCLSISYLYLNRAQMLAQMPKVVKAMSQPYPIWDDFDTAIKYVKKYLDPTRDILQVTGFYLSKGEAAYTLGEYDVALDAYQAGEDYFDEKEELFCKSHNNTEFCKSTKKSYVSTLSYRRARVYLRTGDGAKALENINHYIREGPFVASTCAETYRLRAQAYRLLSDIELAVADEEEARTAPSQTGCG